MRAVGTKEYSPHIISLFLISLALVIPKSTATLSGNETDRLALLAFRENIVDDPLGVISSWNNYFHVCNWYGITCSKPHQRVTSLNLSSQSLVGTLSPHIGNMSFLSEIDLYNNRLYGTIPQEVGRLFRLKVLSLGENSLDGMIPTSISNLLSLTVFNLASNQLQGSIPSDIGLSLPNLQMIRLSYNKFTGSIPASLSNASKLQAIDLQSNNLSGPISVDFGRLPYLQILRLSNNNLGFGEQGHLSFLDPLTNCSSLQILELGTNNFQRSLPRSIANLSNALTILSLADNQISGSIPFEISNYINLILLSLEGNKFTGIIPSEIVQLGKLQRVFLSNNRLSGNIPASIGNLSLLDEIHLEDNELSGKIPPSFGNCRMLVFLDLSQNYLSGTIPNNFFDIAPFSVKLDLSRNHLVGSLPGKIGALKTMVELDVSENEFSGFLPELGNCISLTSLYIQGNLFQGYIPRSLGQLKGLQYIDFSRNNLSDEFPSFLETLTALNYLNLSWNNLEGEVPVTGVFANISAFSIVGNKRLCGGIPILHLPRCTKNGPNGTINPYMAWVQLLILIGSIQDLIIITCVFQSWRRRKQRETRCYSSMKFNDIPNKMSYELLHQATKGFSRANLVSESGFGLVYKGKLGLQYIGIPEGEKAVVAIKVFDTSKEEAANRFKTECETLQNIRHRNIVKVLSTCSSTIENNKFQAIVYDFMKHESLKGWLHPTNKTSHDKLNMPQKLNLDTKINIAIDVASALDYLHTQLDNPLIHCNLKPSNILLDTNMTAIVSNFGRAKFITEFSITSQSILTGFEGTTGYVPPEYGLGSTVSTKGDVYSYGILLLEMLTGIKTTDPMFQNGFKLQNFISNALSEGAKEIIDPVNLHELTRDDASLAEDCLSILFNIGVKCALELPQFRPDISDILSMLETVRIIFKANTGSTKAYANKSSQAAVLMAQRNMKSLLLYGNKKMPTNARSMSISPSVRLSYMDIHNATNGLSLTNLLGTGGFGSVYKGTFHQDYVRLLLRNSGIEDDIGTAVAIKVFNLQRRGAAKSFNTEYQTLGNIHHINLVKIITTCTTKDQEGRDFQAILYEFMDNGSLEMWLHPTNKTYHDGAIKPRILSLHARINLVIGVACALSYLHHQCDNCIIHCDLKPSNILLDKHMVARIADFGLAISLPESSNLSQSSRYSGLRGTTGYIAPEYGLGSKITTKGDTYSFGILLLEILTRKKPTHRMFRGGLNLHNFVWMALPNNVMDITDPLMMVMVSANEGNGLRVEECLTRMFNIGLACSKPSPKDRPSIREVLGELESIRNSF